MAATTGFKVQCPSCEAMVTIKNASLVGKKIDCPKCKYRFVVDAPADLDEETAAVVKGKKAGGGTAVARKSVARSKAVDDDDDDDDFDEDPPDEPVAQQVSPGDQARVARMTNEVLVIDGRPRYHLPGCVHLLGRDSEPLPVHEAVELGFTPCGLCEPDSALIAASRRV